MTQRALIHIDFPADGRLLHPATEIGGWIATADEGPIERPALVNARGNVIDLILSDRPDVRKAHPYLTSTGFRGCVDIRVAADGPWWICYTQNATSVVSERFVFAEATDAAAFARAKSEKLTWIRDLLRCPYCRTVLDQDGASLFCGAGHRFSAGSDAFSFIDRDLREEVGVVDTENVSAHEYDATLIDLIAKSTGPILDVGAGQRPIYRSDVINVEVVPYPTTDVLCASEYLPFADETFDLVISVAVLEHVRDPFAAARELMRVLKPGGRIFAAVPFLQPYHAYPNHYYNMTSQGLRNLFNALAVERLDVPLSGGPIFALTWMLRLWQVNLPPDAARAFADMTVADLTVDPMQLIDAPFVRDLPEALNTQLASLNVLVGRKPK